MSKPKSQVMLSEAILEEASSWFIDFNEGELDAGGREQFHQWLRRSPEHVRAYVEIAAAWEDSSRLSHPGTLETDDLIKQALAERNVIPLQGPAEHDVISLRGGEGLRRMRQPVRLFAFAATVLLVLAGTWFYTQRNTYTTATGEQRSITLSDGSTVELNSRSKLRVRFSEHARDVELLEGQALFQVKKDYTRPFVVDSNGTHVRAVGTQFDVYKKSVGTVVTVIEGRVAVIPPSNASSASGAFSYDAQKDRENTTSIFPPRRGRIGDDLRGEVFLSAGEQLTVSAQLVRRPIRVDVANATAWTQRKLIFNETPLMEAVAEFNRYNTRQMVIADPALAEFHIRGNFQATDPDRLIQFLRDRFGVRASEQGQEILISKE